MNLDELDAVLFDLDGVITPTAEIHMRAWAELFGAVLAEEGISEPYTDADYFTYVDGKPRYDGVASFLESRGIERERGKPSDPPEAPTVCGLGNRKQKRFAEILERDGIEAFPGSLRLMDALDERGVPMAIVSSSTNAKDVLGQAGVLDRFRVIVDGTVADEEHLPGKPAPDTFVAAATKLGVTPDRAAVFEDATSGVRAGKAGRFALVVGVDRGAGAQALTRAGADRVVTDLADVLADLA